MLWHTGLVALAVGSSGGIEPTPPLFGREVSLPQATEIGINFKGNLFFFFFLETVGSICILWLTSISISIWKNRIGGGGAPEVE